MKAGVRLFVGVAIAVLSVTIPPMSDELAGGSADGVLDSSPVKLDRLDPAIDRIIPKGAMLERVADGFKWVEGPVWTQGSLYFAEIPSNTIRKWTPGSGVSSFFSPAVTRVPLLRRS